jgi:hypothetical protein
VSDEAWNVGAKVEQKTKLMKADFSGARVFASPEAAKSYLRKQGASEEDIAKMVFMSADQVPLRIRRNTIVDESIREKTTRNQRRRLRRKAAKGVTK